MNNVSIQPKMTPNSIDWSTGLASGVIVELTICRYRGINFVDQLGLNLDTNINTAMEKFFLSAQKNLLPSKFDAKLKTIETQARNNLGSHSFSCDLLGTKGKFVPLAAYLDFKTKNEILQKEFYSIRDDIAANYNRVINDIRKNCKDLVYNLFNKYRLHNAKFNINIIVNDIVAQIPSYNDIVGSFKFTTALRRMPKYVISSADLGIDGRAGKLKAATPPMVCLGKTDKTHDITTARKQLEKDLVSSGGKTDKATADFLTDTAIRLREIMIEGGTKVVESIDRNDNMLVGRASIMAHNLISLIRALDYYGDADMQKAIDLFDYELDGRVPRSVPKVRTTALSMIAWAKASIKFLNGEIKTQPKPLENKTTEGSIDNSKQNGKKHAINKTVSNKRSKKSTIVIPTVNKNERTVRNKNV